MFSVFALSTLKFLCDTQETRPPSWHLMAINDNTVCSFYFVEKEEIYEEDRVGNRVLQYFFANASEPANINARPIVKVRQRIALFDIRDFPRARVVGQAGCARRNPLIALSLHNSRRRTTFDARYTFLSSAP